MGIESQTIGDALVQIADKLQIGTTELVKIYAKVQFAFGLLMIIESLTFVIGTLLVLRWFNQKWVKSGDNGGLVIKAIVLGVIVIMLPFLIDIIGGAILRFWYPDYYAIETLIHQLTN